MKIGERKSPALGGTPGLTMYRTTARGKTVVKVNNKFTLFRVIVKSKKERYWSLEEKLKGGEGEDIEKDEHRGTESTEDHREKRKKFMEKATTKPKKRSLEGYRMPAEGMTALALIRAVLRMSLVPPMAGQESWSVPQGH
jgi:hypothetical protein